MKTEKIFKEINRLKKHKNAVILAHNYQLPEIQQIADIIGDSLALSKAADKVDNDLIVFCGVHFMAESAKILAYDKKVVLPVKDAGCPMANMITANDLKDYKAKNPETTVVCYVNLSAEVKSESDVCCTSSNALRIVENIDSKKILFIPDKNLGNYIKNKLKGKEIELWPGFCPTHNIVKKTEVMKMKAKHLNAELLAHPECKAEVLELADVIGSTSKIIEYVAKSQKKKFIIATEMGVLYKLKRDNPNKEFIILSPKLVCQNMKKTKISDVLNALKYEKHLIEVEKNIREKALNALNRMFEIG